MYDLLKKPLMIGIFGGLIVIYLAEPLLTFTGNLLHKSTLSVVQEFIDSKYARASFLDGLNYAYYLTTGVVALFTGSIIFLAGMVIKLVMLDRKESFHKSVLELSRKKRNAILSFMIIYLVTVPIYVVIHLAGEKIALNSVSKFNRDLNTLRPYIENKDFLKIKSEWSLMKSKSDYNNIYNKLNETAVKNNVILRTDEAY